VLRTATSWALFATAASGLQARYCRRHGRKRPGGILPRGGRNVTGPGLG